MLVSVELYLLAVKANETNFSRAIEDATDADQTGDIGSSSFRHTDAQLEVFPTAGGKLRGVAPQLGGNLLNACR